MTARFRRSPLDALRAALAPGMRPDIDLGELPNLDAEIPCEGLRSHDGGACDHPAVWLMLVICPACPKVGRGLYCEWHRTELLRLRPDLGSRCCSRRDFTWRWQPL